MLLRNKKTKMIRKAFESVQLQDLRPDSCGSCGILDTAHRDDPVFRNVIDADTRQKIAEYRPILHDLNITNIKIIVNEFTKQYAEASYKTLRDKTFNLPKVVQPKNEKDEVDASRTVDILDEM